MSAKEIEQEILKLPADQRKKLLESFIPRVRKATVKEAAEIQAVIEQTSDDAWVDWDDLKSETGH